jgi:ribulose-5-phosphate 4-epimerase/fuculose-1-phosphate aldolase
VTRSLRALFLRRVVSLDAVSISMRRDGSLTYVDASTAAYVLLGLPPPRQTSVEAPARLRALHDRTYARFDDIHAIVTGRPPHVMGLLDAGLSLGEPTSMMKKRNVPRPDDHVVPEGSLDDANLDATLSGARARTDAADMAHMLIVVRGWGVVCCAPNLPEAVTHFQNVELAARLEVARQTTAGDRA